MTALVSGAVDCQLTTSPYLFYESDVDTLHEVSNLEAVWPNGNSFIVGMASNALYDGNPQLYQALVEALAEAEAFIEQNADEAAEFLATYNDVSKEVMLSWLNDPGCSFTPKLQGAMTMAEFMAAYGFIAEKPDGIGKLAYGNVEGE